MTADEKVNSIRECAYRAIEEAYGQTDPLMIAAIFTAAMNTIVTTCGQAPTPVLLQRCDDCRQNSTEDPTIAYRPSEDVCLCDFCYKVRYD